MSTEARFQVVVVGAGPAGALCALHLARGGASVALVDRREPPRYKTCGGGLTARARKILERDVALDGVVEAECHRAELRLAASGQSFRIEHPVPLVTMTQRADLDARIVRAAREAGAELIAPRTVKRLEREGSGLILHTDAAPLRGRHVVAADGATGPTARLAGWGELPRRVPALESEIEVEPDILARFRGAARFDFDVPADGYAWVFPKRTHLSVGCVTTSKSGRGLQEVLAGYLASIGLEETGKRSDHGALIPIEPRAKVLARDGVLLVGDSAGLVDPLTCEGLGNALESGAHAARAILEAGGQPGNAERGYQLSLKRKILPELARARFLARLVYRAPRLRTVLFRRLGAPLARAMGALIAGEKSYAQLLGSPGNWLRGAAGLARGAAGRR